MCGLKALGLGLGAASGIGTAVVIGGVACFGTYKLYGWCSKRASEKIDKTIEKGKEAADVALCVTAAVLDKIVDESEKTKKVKSKKTKKTNKRIT